MFAHYYFLVLQYLIFLLMKSISFVKSESETSQYNNNNSNNNKNRDNDKDNNATLGVEVAQLYDSIISTPSTSATVVKTKPTTISFIKDDNTEKTKESIYCEVCDMKVKDSAHFHGTAHLVSSQKEITTSQHSPTSSHITTTITRLEIKHGQDLALKLMKKCGWDYGQGLGKNNQGEKYPLTATWKQDRLGLGHPNTIKKKITNKSILKPSSTTTIQQQKIKGKQLAADAKAESTLRSAMLHYMNN